MYRAYNEEQTKFVFTTNLPRFPDVDVIFSNFAERTPTETDPSNFSCWVQFETEEDRALVEGNETLQQHIKDRLVEILETALNMMIEQSKNHHE